MDRDDDPIEGARDRQRPEPDLGDEDPEGDRREEDEAKFRAVPQKGQDHGQEDGEARHGGDQTVGVLDCHQRVSEIRHDGTVAQRPVRAGEPRVHPSNGPTEDDCRVGADGGEDRHNLIETPPVKCHARSELREPTSCDKVSLRFQRVRREPPTLVPEDCGNGPSAAPLHDDHITTARAPIEFHDAGTAEVLDFGVIAPGAHGALDDWTGHGGSHGRTILLDHKKPSEFQSSPTFMGFNRFDFQKDESEKPSVTFWPLSNANSRQGLNERTWVGQ